MDWYQELYIGKTAKKREQEIRTGVEEHRRFAFVWLIVTAPDGRNQLEILSPSEYYRQILRKGESKILGIACGMQEAMELVRQMTEDVYRATGAADIRGYFTGETADGRAQCRDNNTGE